MASRRLSEVQQLDIVYKIVLQDALGPITVHDSFVLTLPSVFAGGYVHAVPIYLNWTEFILDKVGFIMVRVIASFIASKNSEVRLRVAPVSPMAHVLIPEISKFQVSRASESPIQPYTFAIGFVRDGDRFTCHLRQ